MQRVLDVLIAAVILAVPALAVAQAPAASVVSASSHHYLAASLIKPNSASNPADPGVM